MFSRFRAGTGTLDQISGAFGDQRFGFSPAGFEHSLNIDSRRRQ